MEGAVVQSRRSSSRWRRKHMATTARVALQGDGEGALARRMHRRWD
uniref:Uncharacterized protein n=1 Tax=Arundo donax TaxID=35708 RepID=A0A0A9C5I0_ARUDO